MRRSGTPEAQPNSMQFVEATAPNPADRARHLGAARPQMRAHRRAGDAARLSPHRHRPDVRQRARGRRGAARLGRASATRCSSPPRCGRRISRRAISNAPPRRAWRGCGSTDVDLLLIHWPNPQMPLAETIGALCKMKQAGFARHIGVSNFTVALIERGGAARDRAAGHQPDRVASLSRPAQGASPRAASTAWRSSPIARSRAAAPQATRCCARIGKAHGKTAAQVCLRYLVQQGAIVIPRTSKIERLAENIVDLRFRARRRGDGRDRRAGRAAAAASSTGAGRRTGIERAKPCAASSVPEVAPNVRTVHLNAFRA